MIYHSEELFCMKTASWMTSYEIILPVKYIFTSSCSSRKDESKRTNFQHLKMEILNNIEQLNYMKYHQTMPKYIYLTI